MKSTQIAIFKRFLTRSLLITTLYVFNLQSVLATDLEAPCELYPITLPANDFSGLLSGNGIEETYDGMQGNFGYLTWNGNQDAGTLSSSLLFPGNSETYINPDDANDHLIEEGRWVRGAQGVKNSKELRDNLALLIGKEILIPLWDDSRAATSGSGNTDFHIASFAKIVLTDYRQQSLDTVDKSNTKKHWITYDFLGFANCGNEPPIAESQDLITLEDTPLNVLINAVDPDEDVLVYSIVDMPLNGELSGSGVNYTYTPNENFNGADVFTFQAFDGEFLSEPASINITIQAVNDAPTADDQNLITDEDVSLEIILTGADIDEDPLNYIVQVGPSNGVLSGSGANLTYTPNNNYFGQDSFTFVSNDGELDSSIATVNITVNPINDAPIADDQNLETLEDTPLSISLTASDAESVMLAYMLISQPTSGVLSGSVPNFVYTPNENYTGQDSFSFSVSDGELTSEIAVIDITVIPVNDAPLFVTEPVLDTTIGETYSYDSEAVDPDLDDLSYSITQSPSGASINPNSGEVSWADIDSMYFGNDQNKLQSCVRPADAVELGPLEAKLKWHWTGPSFSPGSDNVFGPVTVGQLTDDNNDGLINNLDSPDIVFTSGGSTGVLNIVDGVTGDEIFSSKAVDITIYGSPSLADIDGDGITEILVPGGNDRRLIYAFEHDGTLKWSASTGPLGIAEVRDAVAIADLDADGNVEIVHGSRVFDKDGNLLWVGNNDGGGYRGYGYLSFAADINLDNKQEVIAGRTLYDYQGNTIWHQSAIPTDGYNAIGNFDQDDFAEIVLVTSGVTYLLDNDGSILWSTVIPGGGAGGAPTVADFDGDGEPEIGVAGGSRYVIYETDGSVKWTRVTRDVSSNRTGSSVFDFNLDGKAEVVYADEINLYIFDGQTGATLLSRPNTSGTTLEYPVIADIDNDGSAEILYASNLGSSNGLRAIESSTVPWAPTRSLWNQHAYSIDNINDDFSVPSSPVKTWLTHNTFRLNTFPENSGQSVLDSSDLAPYAIRLNRDVDSSSLTASIKNRGVVQSSDFTVSFYNGSPETGEFLGEVAVSSLEAGSETTVSLNDLLSVEINNDIYVVVDAQNSVNECDEANNTTVAAYFEIQVADPSNEADTQSYLVNITNPNISPEASNQSLNTPEDIPLNITLSGSDVDGNEITYILLSNPQNGVLTGTGENLVYTPNENYFGEDQFTYLASDGQTDSNIATVSIQIELVNDIPAYVTQTISEVSIGESYLYSSNAIDADGDSLTYSLSTQPTNMSIDEISGDISWSSIDSSYNGNDQNNLFTCVKEPVDSSQLEAKLKWHWSGSSVMPSHNQVMMAPIVVPLVDTNNDGLVNELDDPAIIFSTFSGFRYQSDGVIRAVNGKDGSEIWTITDSAFRVSPGFSVAAADIDLDGEVEIVTGKSGGGLIVFEADGAHKFNISTATNFIYAGVAIANIDQSSNGPEIIYGNSIYSSTGDLIVSGSGVQGRETVPLSFTADIDIDGDLEIIAGAYVYEHDGTVKWSNTEVGASGDGHSAVANFDDDDEAEIVVVNAGKVALVDHDGNKLWEVALPGVNGGGGPPTIADMDGDGEPEIGVAGASFYSVFNSDGSILWNTSTQDASSRVTGSSVFDFNGDGSVEIVYADERNLRIYNGVNGEVLLSIPNPSGTLFELPVIADVDSDSQADIVVISNNYAFSGTTGIRVFEAKDNNWVNTRNIWNQHAYSINNVNDDGSIPAYQEPSWLTHNTFRLNTFGSGISALESADLSPLSVLLEIDGVTSSLTTNIKNRGLVQSGNYKVSFYNGAMSAENLLGQVDATSLQSYAETDVTLASIDSSLITTDITVVVDSDGNINECDESNNSVTAALVITQVSDSFGGTDSQTYLLNITNDNQSPVVGNQTLTTDEDVSVNFNLAASDVDGDSLTYQIVSQPSFGTLSGSGSTRTYIPKSNYSGQDSISYIVNDGSVDSALGVVSITINSINDAPQSFSYDLVTNEDVALPIVLNGTDVDGDILTYIITVPPANGTISGSGATLIYTPNANYTGTDGFNHVASDGELNSNESLVTIAVASLNDAPVITTTPDVSVNEGAVYIYDVNATEPDGEAVIYELQSGSSTAAIDESTGLITWDTSGLAPLSLSIDNTQCIGQAELSVLSAALVQTSDAFEFNVSLRNRGLADTVSPFTVQVYSADPSSGALPIASTEVASVLATSTEMLTFTLDEADLSSTLLIVVDSGDVISECIENNNSVLMPTALVTVTDPHGASDYQYFTLNILNVNEAPVFTSVNTSQAITDELFSYQAIAQDADIGDALVFEMLTWPTGASINPITGLVEWTPNDTQVGIHPFSIKVTDLTGAFNTQSFEVEVLLAGVVVPNVVGETEADAISTIIAGDLVLGVVSYLNDPVVVVGNVISQSPDSGALVEAGTLVDLIVSLGPTIINIPDLSGLTQAQAEAQIEALGLVVGTVTTATDPTVPSGSVISTNPPVGSDLPEGSTVDLLISEGPAQLSVPNVVGSVQAAAESTIVSEGFVVGSVTEVFSESVPAGTVVSQTPNAGVIADEGSNISLEVSKGEFVDEVAPVIVVSFDREPARYNPNDVVTLNVSITDNIEVTSIVATLNGQPLAITQPQTIIDISGLNAASTNTVVITASDAVPNSSSVSLEFFITDPNDTTFPTVDISSPVVDSRILAPSDIIGTVFDDNLDIYELAISPAGENEYTVFHTGSNNVSNGFLGTFDPTQLLNGIWDIRLSATDLNGQRSEVFTRYYVDSDMKIGNFSISFQDFNIPVTGIPVTLTRTYDTRRRFENLDFGYGWSVDYQNIRIQENRVQGEGWSTQSSGGLFPTYCVEGNGEHMIAVTLPDGRVEEFDMDFTLKCQQFVPLSTVTPIYVARPGTFSTLVPQDVGELLIDNSNGVLLDGSTVEPYNVDKYTLTTVQGYVYELDQNFGITSVTDTNGNTLTFSASGVVHSNGEALAFTRDTQGRITEITAPDNSSIEYIYDANGDLVSMIDQIGLTTQFTYNSTHGLLDIIDPRGVRVSRNEYDDDGRLIATIDADGNRIEYTHDLGANTEQVKDRRGFTTTYVYDNDGNVLTETNALGETITRTYDDDHNELTVTDALGNTTTNTFDTKDNQLSETDPLGNVTLYTYDAENQLLSLTDAAGNLVADNVFDTDSNLTSLTDALGQDTQFEYDTKGQLAQMTDALGQTSSTTYTFKGYKSSETDVAGIVTSYTYDDLGRNLSMTTTRTDADGLVQNLVTQYEYDLKGRLLKTTDALGNITNTEYNEIDKPILETDANGNQTSHEYDIRGNKVKTTYADSSFEIWVYDKANNLISQTDRANQTTTMEYDAANRLVKTTYADNTFTMVEYDAAGRQTAMVDARGNRTEYTFDAAGRNTEVKDALGNITTYVYDSRGNRTSMTDANAHTTSFTYDDLSRVIQTTYHDASTMSVEYDALGRKIKDTDQAGKVTEYAYDERGNLTKVTDALLQETTYGYDEQSSKLTQTDALGRTTTWGYDNLGRVVGRTLPQGQSESMTYDAVGNMLTRTDFNGAVSNYSYNNLNQNVLMSYADGKTVASEYTIQGLPFKVTDHRGVTQYAYDTRDRMTMMIYPNNQVLEYQYDANGNRTQLDASTGTVYYSFDVLNRLQTVEDGDALNPNVTTYLYDAVGNRSGVNHANGNETRYVYDSLNRLTNITVSDSLGVELNSHTYALAPAGQRTSETTASSRVVNYVYDDLYRLVEEQAFDAANSDRTTSYVYDMVGNRLSQTENGVTTTYTYNDTDQLLTEVKGADTTIYTYDINGNTLNKTSSAGVVEYTYDSRDRLLTMNDGVQFLEYDYDASGIRQSKSVDGVTEIYLVDTLQSYAQVIATLDNSGNPLATYTYGLDRVSQTISNNVSFYHFDGLGSTRLLSDGTGAVTDSYTYKAFGEVENRIGNTANDYLFTGEQYDANLGFYYLRARYYNPMNGRMFGLDTYHGNNFDPRSLHKYLYTHADPINNIDPSGNTTLSGANVASIGLGIIAGLATPRLVTAFSNATTDLGFPQLDPIIGPKVRRKARQLGLRLTILGIGTGIITSTTIRRRPDGHHTVPKYMGGVQKQRLVPLARSIHSALHSAISTYGVEVDEIYNIAFKKHLSVLSIGNRRPLTMLAQSAIGRRKIQGYLKDFYNEGWFETHPSFRPTFEFESGQFVGGKYQKL